MSGYKTRLTSWFGSRCPCLSLSLSFNFFRRLDRLDLALGQLLHFWFTLPLGLDFLSRTRTSGDLYLTIQPGLDLPISRSDLLPFLLHPLHPRIRLTVYMYIDDPFPFLRRWGGIDKHHQTVFAIMYDFGKFFHDTFETVHFEGGAHDE